MGKQLSNTLEKLGYKIISFDTITIDNLEIFQILFLKVEFILINY